MDEKNVGLILCDFIILGEKEMEFLQRCFRYCDSLIVVLAEDNVYRRAYASEPELTYDQKKEWLMQQTGIEEVLQLPYRCVEPDFFIALHETYPFQVFFYGTECGQEFLREKKALEQLGVMFVSFVPRSAKSIQKMQDARCKMQTEQTKQNLQDVKDTKSVNTGDSFRYMLEHLMPDIRIVLFGAGKYFDLYMEKYGTDFPPEYAVDNDKNLWRTRKSGVRITAPKHLKKEETDRILVILCCKNYEGMKEQLLSMGDFDYRILQREERMAFLQEYTTAMRAEGRYLDEAHKNLRILLREIDRVCAKHHLHYYLIGGSLIGVLRHQDFIPWDDDLDISMTRKDYEYLRRNADRIWKDSDFRLVEPDQLGGNAFSDCFPRILYKKGYVCSKTYMKVKGKADEELQNKYVVDIFLLDKASDQMWKHKLVTLLMKGVYGLLMGHRAYVDYATFDRLSPLKLFGVKVLVHIGKMIPAKLLFAAYERLSRYAEKEEGTYYFESGGNINYMPLLHRRDMFGEGKRMKMGDMMVSVPEKPEESLTSKGYRNFMGYPPVADRKPEHTGRNKGVLW